MEAGLEAKRSIVRRLAQVQSAVPNKSCSYYFFEASQASLGTTIRELSLNIQAYVWGVATMNSESKSVLNSGLTSTCILDALQRPGSSGISSSLH